MWLYFVVVDFLVIVVIVVRVRVDVCLRCSGLVCLAAGLCRVYDVDVLVTWLDLM